MALKMERIMSFRAFTRSFDDRTDFSLVHIAFNSEATNHRHGTGHHGRQWRNNCLHA